MKLKTLSLAALFLVFSFHAQISAKPLETHQGSPFPANDPNLISPFANWKTLESDHFRVTFPVELRKIAIRTTDYLEETHAALSKVFKWQPTEKTQILVLDNQDSANGAAAAALRFGIILWVTPPESWHSTGYYDDWLRFLVVHEYTHMLNLDARDGLIWNGLRYVLGYTGLPNSSWAPWMIEGLAVYMETRYTGAGRGRSPYYEMLLRSAVDEKVLNQSKFITLDKVNGPNPYFPQGDTRYQFGYQLMNEVARQNPIPQKHILGNLSQYSSGHIPFFTNEQLKAVSGKNWYQTWDDWVSFTQSRIQADLTRIRSEPVTEFKLLTENSHENSNEVSGPRVSPDGQSIAYTLDSTQRRPGLYLQDLKTGKTRRLEDKLNGVGLAFTADSKAILFSALQQSGQYRLYSDLRIYDLQKNQSTWLTHHARLRDPDLSPDGKWVAATLAEASTVGLVILPFSKVENSYEVGKPRKLYMPPQFDRVSSPRFSKDGHSIYFSLHRNGISQEDLYKIDLKTLALSSVFADGFYNRFPTFSPNGTLYFVSNATGVDNVFRLKDDGTSEIVTNMVSGINFPTFSPIAESEEVFYASVFSTSGWDLAQVKALPQPLQKEKVQLPPPPAPASEKLSDKLNPEPSPQYLEYDYSIFPSIYPRAWSPLGGISSAGIAVGAAVIGFDALDLHRYTLGAIYNSPLQNLDAWAIYSNRSWGPALDFSANWGLGIQNLSGQQIYSRELIFSASVEYPVLWTYSSLRPSLNINFHRLFYYGTTDASLTQNPTGVSDNVISVDATVSIYDTETSALALGTERGGSLTLGSRVYLRPGETSAKLYFRKDQFIPLAGHTILNPFVKALWSSTLTDDFLGANTALQGRNSTQILNPFPSNGYSRITIRGFPGQSFATRATAVAGMDLKFPLLRIFRGKGTLPLFLENLYGIGFMEGAYVNRSVDPVLTSAGGGLHLTSQIFFLPVEFSVEYHQGFQPSSGGKSDLFFQISLNGFNF